jgi:thiol-disulfide isomerase/thioredoxin
MLLEAVPLLTLPFRTVSIATLVLGALAGCDRQSEEPAQPQESSTPVAVPDAAVLTGTPDYTFAGTEMPDAQLTDPSGQTLELAEKQGQPVLLNLWATWCVPCVTEMPLLDELAAETEGDLDVVTVSMDLQGAEAVEPFFAQHGLPNLPRWIDTEYDLGREFGGGPGLPITVLYDAEGKEVWRILGAYEWNSAEARELIAEAL